LLALLPRLLTTHWAGRLAVAVPAAVRDAVVRRLGDLADLVIHGAALLLVNCVALLFLDSVAKFLVDSIVHRVADSLIDCVAHLLILSATLLFI
jgi:hypothetical protein